MEQKQEKRLHKQATDLIQSTSPYHTIGFSINTHVPLLLALRLRFCATVLKRRVVVSHPRPQKGHHSVTNRALHPSPNYYH